MTAPDYADVIAEQVIAAAGTSITQHDLVARAVREGYRIGYGAAS